MKKFLIDIGLFLLIQVILIFIIPFLGFKSYAFGIVVIILFELMLLVGVCIIGKPLFLFPIDLSKGKITQKCYFDSCLAVREYNMLRKGCVCLLCFTNVGETINLWFPSSRKIKELTDNDLPPVNQLLTITYYPYSKILLSWELA